MPTMVSDRGAREIARDARGTASVTAPMRGAVTLLDGQTLLGRPIQPDDVERLRAFHRRLSRDAIIYRFFRYMPELSESDARHFTRIDYDNRMALVATTGEGAEEQIVGVARYERTGPEAAEVAFVVEDHWQGHGIATALLHRLAGYARQRGFTRFVAVTMGTNLPMLDVFRHAGYPCALRFVSTEYSVELDIREPAPEEAGDHR